MYETTVFLQLLVSVLVVLGGAVGGFVSCSLMESFGERRHIKHRRTLYLQKVVRYSIALLASLALCLVWGINLAGAWVMFTSIFGIIGIALFAQWSILSNVTACFILFFSSPIKIDDFITVKDGDNSVSGEVSDMTLFYVRLISAEGERVHIPNSVIMQKAVLVHPPRPEGAESAD
ncbi:mechanosensitive ion channel domain-containing protein [uncultured Desulfuromonas sp.]|uniref:mechanosensitive ion channel domain-containing protein n=1 Tax=uncultured Desulfuromonas sp. TaxID=181013 RepID=UPI00263864A2|nr:mechanosensitive ion channel domain-containing protein [uncultured Desulfuromonas sp.]